MEAEVIEMTNEADKILEMIEGVDPADTETMDEIDARFWCLLEGAYFVKMYGGKMFEFEPIIADGRFQKDKTPKEYTRSLDAIKAVEEVELEGWYMCSTFGGRDVCAVDAWRPDSIQDDCTYKTDLKGKDLPTEHLARLHAAVQAIKWKRENNGK